MWHARMAFWVETCSGDQAAEGSAEAKVSEMLQGFGDLPALRAELPQTVARLRGTCAEMVARDPDAYVQFHAFSAYMALLHLTTGVSDKMALQPAEEGGGAPPMHGGAYDVTVPAEHNAAMWQYLNGFYANLSEADAVGVNFNAEGYSATPVGVYPAPSQGSMTSVRYLTQRCVQPYNARAARLDNKERLMLAVLASRMVLESEVEDVYAGPLGLLLLTQCEWGRPAPLREVALRAFRRLRGMARSSLEQAAEFFKLQQNAVFSLFRCAGAEAARSLSGAFVRQWGPKLQPWLEGPHYEVLRAAAAACAAGEGRSLLPLLEVFGSGRS